MHKSRGVIITKPNRRGVTLIELVMVITIVGVLTGVSSMYIKETIDLWRFMTFRNELVSGGRLAIMRMMREIRQIKDNTSINAAETSRLQFVDMNTNSIDYQLTSGNLMRNTDILASGVNSLTFIYYDINNNLTTTPANIKRINITLQISSGGQTKTLNVQAYPRNL